MSDPGVMLKEETSRWSLLDFKELKKIPCSFVTIRLSIEIIYVFSDGVGNRHDERQNELPV